MAITRHGINRAETGPLHQVRRLEPGWLSWWLSCMWFGRPGAPPLCLPCPAARQRWDRCPSIPAPPLAPPLPPGLV